MTCTDIIKQHLDAHASTWVPAPLLYTIASAHKYSHDEIKRALSNVSHTPPYATWSVMADDHRALKEHGIVGKGVYYRKHPMTPAQLARNQTALDTFEAL